jgi:hypothetical protein
MDLESFSSGIRKTGYPLEYETVRTLQDDGWSVISNKYYLDNDEEKPREVDVLAYKVSTANPDFNVYTTLIISCKKSEHSNWAFLTRDSNFRDPNADWEPTHFCTHYKPLDFMMKATKNWSSEYHRQARSREVKEVLRLPSVEVFATQEMATGENKVPEGKACGDQQIFSSIMSLMKAQFYEMAVRRDNIREKPAIYQFNLVSLAETQFVRLHFDGANITPVFTDSEHYIARYIFNRKEVFARILFVRANAFLKILKDYDRLHLANCEIFNAQSNAFYDSIMKDPKKVDLFKEEFIRKLELALRRTSFTSDRRPTSEVKIHSLLWNIEKSVLQIDTSSEEEDLELLNGYEYKISTGQLLKTIYRYQGEFEFINDIPF